MANNSNNRRPAKQAEAVREERRAVREAVFTLLYETEYHGEDTPAAIYARADEDGRFELEARAARRVEREYLGIMAQLPTVDALIGRHAKGWRTGRLSRVSRAVLRLGVYELLFMENIPAPIAINEAVELAKRFDDEKARPFVNGVLNALKNELASHGDSVEALLATVTPAEVTAAEETPAEEAPAEETSAEEAPVEETSAEETPAAEDGEQA